MPSLHSFVVAIGMASSLFTTPAAARDSQLSVAPGPSPLTFNYTAARPDPKNWIGIYNKWYGAPKDGKQVQASLAWTYAEGAKGRVEVPSAEVKPGSYHAYLLAQDGWDALAGPVEVVMSGGGAVSFLLDDFTTQNAREGDRFEAYVRGLIGDQPDGDTRFAKLADGDSDSNWVDVSDDGTISGTPDKAGETRMIVETTGSDGSKAQLRVRIPVRPAGAQVVDRLSVLSFNSWQSGSHVNDAVRKLLQYLKDTQADIVGFQESNDGYATRIALALGWSSWQGPDVGIISRYPIVEVFPPTSVAGAVRVALDGDNQVIVWNAHLGFNPYGPYDFCFDRMSLDQVLDRERESGRTPQIDEIVDRMQEHIANADRVPVILTGDFNAPSHLDWTEATRSIHCDIGDVPWPTSKRPTDAGLKDSYREIHPDPLNEPGNTWSPIFLDNQGRQEPMDRIDFIYHRGLRTIDSNFEVAGETQPEPNHQDNFWTSDHAAVKTIFEVGGRRTKRAYRS